MFFHLFTSFFPLNTWVFVQKRLNQRFIKLDVLAVATYSTTFTITRYRLPFSIYFNFIRLINLGCAHYIPIIKCHMQGAGLEPAYTHMFAT